MMQSFFRRTTKTLIRLRGCAVVFQSPFEGSFTYVAAYLTVRTAILILSSRTMPSMMFALYEENVCCYDE